MVYGKQIFCENPNKRRAKKKQENKKTYIHNDFLSEVSHTIKIQNFDHQNWRDFFVIFG